MSGRADTIPTLISESRDALVRLDHPGSWTALMEHRAEKDVMRLFPQLLDALEQSRADLVRLADQIAWLEGEVAGWRIKRCHRWD